MRKVIVGKGAGALGVEARVGPHTLVLDEPEAVGGNDAGPSPREALLAALGACSAATVKMYARRKGWAIGDVEVELVAIDQPGKKVRIEKRVKITGELGAEELKRCYEIASRCPVHRMLVEGVEMAVTDG